MIETAEEMTIRHKAEMKQFVAERKAAGGKGKSKKKAEELTKQLRKELQRRHAAELKELKPSTPPEFDEHIDVEAMSCRLCDATAKDLNALIAHFRGKRHQKAVYVALHPPCEAAPEEEEEGKKKKLTKAQKRHIRILNETLKREEEEEIAASTRVCQKDVETDKLNEQLFPLGLKIKEVPADGHCLYSAIADQLVRLSILTAEENGVRSLRSQAAHYLRGHSGDFFAFAEVETMEEYEEYCRKVECTAEWGGQVELRALSEVLNMAIEVHALGETVVVMGEEFVDVEPLRVAFQKKYVSLGDHYNSIVPLELE